jgi:predicted Ser/Thr protein kinase
MTDIIELLKADYDAAEIEYMSVTEYLDLCRNDRMAYATAAERMVKAIGEPQRLDTSADPRLSRIFLNRTLRVYPAFKDFYGMEETIERIVGYFIHAAQGLEERKQILYLLGPVGGGKSSLAERLKELMEVHPIYVLCYGEAKEMSPVFESPLGFFSSPKYRGRIEAYGIDRRYLNSILSPWAIKRLKQAGGDIGKFSVAKVYPSKLEQIGVVKTEPGDENNQDISCLVGKTDIRMLEKYSQNDADSYSFSGALCRGNQGLLEFVEMFKSPIKVLHPLLTATQEGNYMGTEAVSAIPFNGIVLAHCFSEDTELLTLDGWRSHEEIQIGDFLATKNIETGKLEYQPALRKFEQNYDGPMYHFESKSADHLVTPNHKMLCHTRTDKNWKSVTAEDFSDWNQIIPVSVENDLPDYPVSDEMLRLMVWTVADGSMASNRIRFLLHKTRKIERLTGLLREMSIPFDLTVYDNENHHIRIDNPGLTKHIPEYYNKLSTRQGRVVLMEYAHTDGHIPEGRDQYYQLSASVEETIDRLQQIAVTSGCKANLHSHDRNRVSRIFGLNIRVGVTETQADNIKELVHYSGNVFCFETENHTLVARRNGKVIITSNSNESEWQTFRANKNNEAFLDRICVVKVPYCLRYTDEKHIYEKMLENSDLKNSTCAPHTLEMLAQFSVLSRIKPHDNSPPWSKMLVYDGKNVKETDPRARSVQEYRDIAGVDEGMNGTSTRFAFKVLSSTFNHDSEEVSADPVHLMYALEKSLVREQLPVETEKLYLDFIKGELAPRYVEFIGNEIQTAYLEAYDEFGQTLFDRYILLADHWLDDVDYKDQDTGVMYDREYLNNELEKIEKAAGIVNPKDFRHECVKFVLRQRAQHKTVKWTSYEKLKKVIEKKMFASTDDLLPIISFGTKSSSEDQQKHDDFVARMVAKGYTSKQVRRIVDWFLRVRKSS